MTTYTITAAQYTNPAHTGAAIETTEVGAVFVQPSDEVLWAQVLAFGPAAYELPPPAVPASVTKRQARRALRLAGHIQTVEAAIAAMTGEAGERAREDWELAGTVERASPLVAAMGAALGLDDAALDELFRQAAALP
ncbi:MAG: hypothetical protein PGN26_14620 [Xylophilus ampelinus]